MCCDVNLVLIAYSISVYIVVYKHKISKESFGIKKSGHLSRAEPLWFRPTVGGDLVHCVFSIKGRVLGTKKTEERG